ncbi:MAG: hypothetical protein NVSMB51_08140 [Solirubrobacteraceae bacterium]
MTGSPRRCLFSFAGAAAGALALPANAAAKAPPAGGAAIGEVITATAMGIAGTLVLLVLVAGHRTGRLPVFSRLAALAERVTGVVGWAALPATVLAGALGIAVFGMYWDISIHIDKGRDPGPLANPAHYFILVGLFGALFAGVMAIALPLREAGRSQVTLPNRWRAPVGGLLIAACGAFSLVAFPLDDIWHRLFGQDVTLWGPTHLMLIGGAGLSVIGAWALQVEGLGGRTMREARELPRWTHGREVILAGALLMGMSTFQAEFDYSVPQFRLIFHPILLMLAAGFVLTAARIRIGRGGALGAAVSFLLLRGLLTIIVGGMIGNTAPHFPLYLAAAAAVELVGLRFPAGRRPLAFGALAGVGVGTIGLAGEWGWTHVWFVNPWPSAMLLEAVLLSVPMAVAAGTLGGALGRALTPLVPRGRAPAWAVPLAAATVAAVIAFSLPMPDPARPIRATVTARQLQGPPHRTIAMTIRLDPPNAADKREWLDVTGWQGGGSVVDNLRAAGPGTYETTKPIPVWGNWKTTLRLQRGRAVLGLPIFLPADEAIPVKEIPVAPQFTRTFVRDKKNLQREQKTGVPGWLTGAAYLAVLLIALLLLAVITWGLHRLEREHRPEGDQTPSPEAGSSPLRASATGGPLQARPR